MFSLSALQDLRAVEPLPVRAETTSDSGLIDIARLARAMASKPIARDSSDEIAALGSDGLFTVVAPDLASARELTPTMRFGRRAWPALAGAVGALAVAALSVLLVKREAAPRLASPGLAPTVDPPFVAMPIPAPATGVEASGSPLPSVETVRTTAAPKRPTQSVTAVIPTAAATSRAAAPETTAVCCAGETATLCEMRRAVGAACVQPVTESVSAFDSREASRALSAVDVHRCGKVDAGHARITFQPNGTVSAVVVDTPELAGTTTERCVADAYRRAKVHVFSGEALTVGKRFAVAGP